MKQNVRFFKLSKYVLLYIVVNNILIKLTTFLKRTVVALHRIAFGYTLQNEINLVNITGGSKGNNRNIFTLTPNRKC